MKKDKYLEQTFSEIRAQRAPGISAKGCAVLTALGGSVLFSVSVMAGLYSCYVKQSEKPVDEPTRITTQVAPAAKAAKDKTHVNAG